MFSTNWRLLFIWHEVLIFLNCDLIVNFESVVFSAMGNYSKIITTEKVWLIVIEMIVTLLYESSE